MKFKAVLFLGILTLGSLAPLASANEELGGKMEEISDLYKAIRKTADPAEGAQLARDVQKLTLGSLDQVPDVIKDMPDGKDKEKAQADYRRLIAASYVKFCEVEIAFLAGDLEKVKTLVEDIKSLKKEGHDAYIEEE